MQVAPCPANEAERLAALHRLLILDTPADADFDIFAALAAALFDAPLAAVSLVDAERQWFKASVGFEVRETPRSISFCGHAIASPEPVFCVEDTERDTRFADNPLVTGPPYIRFYAGAPILDQAGLALGVLCVA